MFCLDKVKNVTLDVLENYLGVIELYNYSFNLANHQFSYEIYVTNKENKSYSDIVKEYFCLEENEEIEFKFIELKNWKIAVNNWLASHLYEAIISMTYEYENSRILKEINQYKTYPNEKYETIEFLNFAKLKENKLSKTFVELLEKYMIKEPKKVFYFESDPDFFYEAYWCDIVIECDDKFIFLHYGISD
ncbi:hypothetical protein H8697_03365 [[Eubacterium] tenue]|nr:hypothetical protein [[Eubacterium] tenue]MBC8630747.1 hypothetical protein [[Eubacterium] tenue]